MAKRASNRTGKDSPGNANPKFVRSGATSATEADWSRARPELVKDVVVSASIVGGAVRFGASRDKGAYAIGLYVEGDVHTEWLPCNMDINELLGDIVDYFVTIANMQGPQDP